MATELIFIEDTYYNYLITENYKINGKMRLNVLIAAHHFDGRPLRFGNLNGVDYEFNTQKSDECGQIQVPDLDIFSLDMFKLVKTKFCDVLQIDGLKIIEASTKFNGFVQLTLEN